jgi:hypothetical protein
MGRRHSLSYSRSEKQKNLLGIAGDSVRVPAPTESNSRVVERRRASMESPARFSSHGPILWSRRRSLKECMSMATVQLLKIEPSPHLGQRVTVELEARSSVGIVKYATDLDDQGSAQANEQEARRELRVFCEEILEVLRSGGD